VATSPENYVLSQPGPIGVLLPAQADLALEIGAQPAQAFDSRPIAAGAAGVVLAAGAAGFVLYRRRAGRLPRQTPPSEG
jgi:hypothetical protein